MSKKINISEFGDCISEENLVKYVNNELTNEENSAIDKHLEHCEMCSDVVDGLLMMDSPNDIFAEKKLLDQEIDKIVAGSTKKRIILNTKFRAIAAVAILLIISGTYFIADYLADKNKNFVIETAEKDNAFDNQLKSNKKPNEQEIADLEEKVTINEQQSEQILLSPSVHDFDSDYKILSNVIFEDESENTVLDQTVGQIEILNSENFSSYSEADGVSTPGSGSSSGNIPTVRTNTDSRKSDITGSATGESASAKESKDSGGIFSIFDLPDKKLEEGRANRVNQKEKDEVSDKELTRSERNNNQAQSPASAEDVVIVEALSINDADMTVLEEEVDEIEVVSFNMVEQKPIYPGGDIALLKFISDSTKYPEEAKQNAISGKVYVQFVIDAEGYVTNVQIAKGVAPILDQEAVRVIKLMPRWTPGKQRGKPVSVSFVVPINFYLN